MSRHLFHAYLALICWIPLPLASKSIIAQDCFVIWVSMLSAVFCFHSLRHRHIRFSTAFHAAMPVYGLFAINLLWLAVQSTALPVEWVMKLSPMRVPYTGLEATPAMLTLSFTPWATHHSLLLSTAYVQLFILTLLLVNTHNRLKTLLYVLVTLGLLQAAYGSIMTLSGIEKTLWFDKEHHLGVATGTLLNRNHLANYLVFCAAAGIGLLLAATPADRASSRRDWLRNTMNGLLGAKGFVRFSLVIMVTGLILTYSRMGNTAFFVSMTAAGLLWLLLTRNLSRGILILFASLIVIDIALVGGWFGIERVADRIENTQASTELRHLMLPYLLKMAEDFQLAGTGAGTFANIFPLYNEHMVVVIYNEAHSDYLQFIIEQGLIGVTPLALIVIWSVGKTMQTLLKSHSRLLMGTGFAIMMALIATGIHASVEYTLQRPATASLFVIFLALPWITAHLETQPAHPHSGHSPSKHS